MDINKVAVIGAGVMGARIAAHISNAGTPVYLLDIVPKGADNRNAIAEAAIKKLLKAEPAALMHKNNARLITPGNIEDHLDLLADVDWVIEAIIEDPKIKHSLYEKVFQACGKDTLVSSNTSTLPLAFLSKPLPESDRARFMITHFFNPPRYMRLLELVSGDETRSDLVQTVKRYADHRLGKGCVICNDTPGFIGNRIGIYWLQCGLLSAMELGLTVEEADAVMGAPAGIPKTGVFGLLDLVGLDLIPHIMQSMKFALMPNDPFQQVSEIPELVQRMIADGYTGRKGKGGFYRLNTRTGERIKEAIDLASGDYRRSERPKLDSVKSAKADGLKALLSYEDKTGQFAWQVLSKTLAYAASLIPEIADDIVSVDAAMRMGYNWKYGPFELLDQIGVEWFREKMVQEGRSVPPLLEAAESMYRSDQGSALYIKTSGKYAPIKRDEGVSLLADFKLDKTPVLANDSASLWDLGEGVACLEFHTKMNTMDPNSMTLILQSINRVQQEFTALVIHNDADNFSAGANLGVLMMAVSNQSWSAVEEMLKQGQETYKALKYAPFPVVGAPSGLALGGGCEILLHCDAIQAHAELYIGLVEVGVGLIPAWGGCKELLQRWIHLPKRPAGPMPPVAKSFETIGMASMAKSAMEAKELLFLSASDGITMNRDRVLADAKAKALALSADYSAPQPAEFPLPGPTAQAALNMVVDNFRASGKATEYDVVISQQLAHVLSGGDCDVTEPLTEEEVLALEREAFMQLIDKPGTLARLEHMLKTGKPLRN